MRATERSADSWIALPSAQHDLGFSDGDRQWVIPAFALAFGSLLLLDGLLLWEPHETTFVNYLRIAFRMGGMPGGNIQIV